MVGIIMGSRSDMQIMSGVLDTIGQISFHRVKTDFQIVSAHRTPEKMFEYAKTAKDRGVKVIVAGAGGAAHLPGMVASLTTLPVIGVPIKSSNSLDGWDSMLSILQMPFGVPVATVAVNGAENAGILACQILALSDEELAVRLMEYKEQLKKRSLAHDGE